MRLRDSTTGAAVETDRLSGFIFVGCQGIGLSAVYSSVLGALIFGRRRTSVKTPVDWNGKGMLRSFVRSCGMRDAG